MPRKNVFQSDKPEELNHIQPEEIKQFMAYLTEHALGQRNAIEAKHLGPRLGIHHDVDRRLRELIRRAIGLGLLVCSGNTGYFIPLGLDEVDRCNSRLASQAMDTLERVRLTNLLARQTFISENLAFNFEAGKSPELGNGTPKTDEA